VQPTHLHEVLTVATPGLWQITVLRTKIAEMSMPQADTEPVPPLDRATEPPPDASNRVPGVDSLG
jgi:hypothetical protein